MTFFDNEYPEKTARKQRRRFLFSPPQKLVHAAPEDFRELDEVRGLREAFAAFPFRTCICYVNGV